MFIKGTDLALAYDGQVIAKNISFELKRGDYLCIVGENGSGKSTLVKTILGLSKPYSGKLEFGGGFCTSKIGYMPQNTSISKGFPASVFEVVLSGRLNNCSKRPFYNKNDKATALHNLELMGVGDLKGKCFQELSGGQQQRVLLARALCATSELLLLDEPMTGLDPHATANLHELISNINKKLHITIIMISHDIHAAVSYSTHILHMGGETPFFGTTGEYSNTKEGREFLCAWGCEHNHSEEVRS